LRSLNVASIFTLIRIVLSPIFLGIYLHHEDLGISLHALPFILLVLLTISEVSDLLDGYLARRMRQVTDLGKLLDPMADSIARISVFLAFTAPPVKLPMLLVAIFVYRDLIIGTLRTICALKGIALAASQSGKIKAVLQAVASYVVLLALIPFTWGYLSVSSLRTISIIAVSVAAFYAVYSAAEYFSTNRRFVKGLLRQRKQESDATL
jgi:CDP-diacylglycerol--glycerol-3-phosphate 3-phosphatidyltransferase